MPRLTQAQILYEDSWIIAINKPSGRFTQAAYGVPNLQVDLVELIAAREPTGPTPFVGIIHRLDRPTSGVLVYGRTAAAVRQMNAQFRERLPTKKYLALVHGLPAESGTAEDWMRKIDDVAKAEICLPTDSQSKQAILHWRRIANDDSHALLEVQLETGRMHQIRLQLAARGYPIVGDSLYGEPNYEATRIDEDRIDETASKSFDEDALTTAVFGLHAAELTFRHPKTAKQITLTATLPENWMQTYAWLSRSMGESAAIENL